jgi:hypothetical protein
MKIEIGQIPETPFDKLTKEERKKKIKQMKRKHKELSSYREKGVFVHQKKKDVL